MAAQKESREQLLLELYDHVTLEGIQIAHKKGLDFICNNGHIAKIEDRGERR